MKITIERIMRNEHGHKMLVNSRLTKKRLMEKEPETVSWINRFVKKGDVFWDVGACVGQYSLLAADQGAKVYAFEPSFVNYHVLCHNILLNNADIFPVPFALGNRYGSSYFSINTHPGSAHNMPSTKGLAVIVAKGDYFEQPDHVKIDTDGQEMEVLKGMDDFLKNVKTILIEIDERIPSSVSARNYIKEAGFSVVEKYEKFGKPVVANYIFVRQ